MIKLLMIGAAFGTLAILIICLLLNISLVGKPFPGFTMESNLTISVAQSDTWPGAKAGLQSGDRIIAIGNRTIHSAKDVESAIRSIPQGMRLLYTVQRENKRLQFRIPTEIFTWLDFVFYALPWILLGFGMLLIGAMVTWFRPKDRIAWVHFGFCLALAILGATNFESVGTHRFSIVNQVSLVLVGVTGLHLSTLFPKPLRVFERSDLLQGILYFPLLIFLPLIILLYPHPDLWRYCFYAIISISSLGVISITLSSLFTTVARNSSPIAKSQAWIVLLGGLVGAFPTVLAYAGGVVGIPSFLLGISNLLLLIFPCAIAYAIVRHRLFDIEIILKKTAIYTIVTATSVFFYFLLLAGFRALLGDQRSLWSNILTTAVIAIIFAPLRDLTKRTVDRTFFRSSYDFRQIVNNFSEIARLTFDAKELIAAFLQEIETALHPNLNAVYLTQGNRLVLTDLSGNMVKKRPEIDPGTIDLSSLSGKKRMTTLPNSLSEFEITIPLMVKEELIGLVALGSRKSDLNYKAEDRELIENLCQQMALYLKNAQLFSQLTSQERIRKELEIAHSVQTGFLPAFIPTFRGLEIAAISRPALEVGGDFYDVVPIGSDSLGILIGDVSGKGVPAALLMAMTVSIFRTIASEQLSTSETLQRLNSLIYANKPSSKMFVTALYAIYDGKDQSLYFANAGHNLPLSSLGSIECSGPALGIMRDADYEECRIDLKVNEMLLFTTDGIEDALNVQGEHFGEKQPLSNADLRRAATPQILIDTVLEDIDRFIQGEQQFDDITLLALKRTS